MRAPPIVASANVDFFGRDEIACGLVALVRMVSRQNRGKAYLCSQIEESRATFGRARISPLMSALTRRQVLLAAALPAMGCASRLEHQDGSASPGPDPDPDAPPSPPAPPETTEPMPPGEPTPEPASPSRYWGRVIEVSRRGAMNPSTQDLAVRDMLTRAMLELTGKGCEADAWKTFFGPSDVVGIKVSPVGFPEAYSHASTLKAIIRGLELAGVARTSIVVFDRYRDMLDACGYPGALPQGIEFAGVVPTYTDEQTQLPGYDASTFVDLPRVYAGDDANDPIKRRSHLADIVSNRLTKIINVPALKDHISAGVTCALKNMTYGMVNNVSRTHQAPDNWTKDFVPAIASMPKIRSKVVLHVCDALRVGYEGGPSPEVLKTADLASLLVATDPVALDRVGWSILDGLRTKAGLPPLAQTGKKLVNPNGGEVYDERQPQHVLAAGAAGLGESDLAKIQRRIIALV